MVDFLCVSSGSAELSINVAAGFYSFVNMQIIIFGGSLCQHTYTIINVLFVIKITIFICGGCGNSSRCGDPNCNHTDYSNTTWVFAMEESTAQCAWSVVRQ